MLFSELYVLSDLWLDSLDTKVMSFREWKGEREREMQMFVTVCCIISLSLLFFLKSRDLPFHHKMQDEGETVQNVPPRGKSNYNFFPFHFTHSRLKFLGIFIHIVALQIYSFTILRWKKNFKLKLMLRRGVCAKEKGETCKAEMIPEDIFVWFLYNIWD